MRTKLYPCATIQMNRLGHLHIWRGRHYPIRIAKYNYHVHGKESDLYFQLESDIESVLNDLPASQRKDIENGWIVHTHFFCDDYFGGY